MEKKKIRIAVIVALMLAGGLTALEAQPVGGSFASQLEAQLSSNGWSEQEVNAFADAASQADWSSAPGASPQAVALALSLERHERLQLSAQEQVQFAQQLAVMTAEMSAVGFDEHDVARGALDAVRGCLGEIRAWMSGGRHGELGQLIRKQIAQAVRSQVQLAAQGQAAGRGPDTERGVGQGGGPPAFTPAAGGFPPNAHGRQ